ncbi:unnamed protein product [Acanthoscelides obtectus]|uniref:Uncharacterized protein n=1 Tax=Acanthoscelides obtectus TaxID=200917 RepID=A0A9P0JRV6_ACAOB|nr:unnamed protein product [Acanthoscelides obtectus]CAK1634727.1 hypothetical protein AOBTE_LOCUS8871 [Acanthoscelides obtectus]
MHNSFFQTYLFLKRKATTSRILCTGRKVVQNSARVQSEGSIS